MEPSGFFEQKHAVESAALPEERRIHNLALLSRALNMGTTVAFIGAGCSAPLSYPTWRQFARITVANTLAALDGRGVRKELKANRLRLHRFEEQLKPEDGAPFQYPLILSTCQRILTEINPDAYYEFLKKTFDKRNRKKKLNINPYDELLKLPIKRFITSNYDGELEKALSEVRADAESLSELRLRSAGDKLPKATRIFTQKPEYYNQLAIFALAHVEDADNLVFHCHGHYEDPKSMVVTERDYQRWYLAQTHAADAFRQTIELLFSSNPILFVGYGLGDDDLLRPLRMLTATRPDRKDLQPLFALLPERTAGADQDYHEFLYDRYGLNVISYVQEETDQGIALCGALRQLHEDWELWLDRWLKKPRIRTVEMRPHKGKAREAYCHYSISHERSSFKFNRPIEKLLKAVGPKASVLAIIGPGGTGKSWAAHRLMKKLHRSNRSFEGYFFWSSYYANDWLTGLDRALSFMGASKAQGSRLDRFAECLNTKRFFLVFDGIERLLRETENAFEGRGISPGASQFLKLLAKPGASTVVITSRLWPREFNPDEKTRQAGKTSDEVNFDEKPTPADDAIEVIRLQELTKDDLTGQIPFTWVAKEVSGLCSLLSGHTYALSIAAQLLRVAGKSKAEEKLTEIRRALSRTPPDRRVSRMIRVALEDVDKHMDQGSRGLALKFMERLALFMSPVDIRTVDICYESATADLEVERSRGKDELLKDLIRRNLVQQVSSETKKRELIAYTMHPIVRSHIFQRVHHASTEALPDFTLPGFTVGSAVIDPGSREQGVRVVRDVFRRLHKASDDARAKCLELTNETQKNRKREEAIALCRSAFGVVRSRMEANTVPRWSSYNDYFGFILRVADLAKSVCDESLWWDYADRHDVEAVEDESGPLYADELAWIYNEIGLTSYSEGTMLDAIAAWEQGYEINRAIDSYDEGGNYLFQSQCNLGAAYIHFGNLEIANHFLREAERTNHRLDDRDHGGRIAGYLGLVQHLRGDFKAADLLYEDAIKKVDSAGGNARAASIFLRHHGDLKIRLDDRRQAKFLLQQSLSLAEANRYPELVAYARLSYGHLHRVEKEYAKALIEYNAALKAAREIGVRRLESEALSELSQLAYDLGDAQIARQRALEALRIANESVLGLRQTHCLVVLGKATIHAGQIKLGLAYLEHARKLAKRQGYWLRGREAEELLQRHGIDSSEWAPS